MTIKELRRIQRIKDYSNAQLAQALHFAQDSVDSWTAGRRPISEVPRAGMTKSVAQLIRELPPNSEPRKKAGNPNWGKGVKRKMSKNESEIR